MKNIIFKSILFPEWVLPFILSVLIFSCNSNQINTTSKLDVDRFMGLWYEIASLPTSFNKNCSCSKIDLELEPQRDYVRVINSCMKGDKQGAVLAKAFICDEVNSAKWKMQLFWPFKTDFYILKVASDYSYAMVGNPDLSQLQILSRTSQIDNKIYNELIEEANALGFNTAIVKLSEQNCE